MDEIIIAIQVIKMYAWEKPFTKLIDMARKMEMKSVWKISLVRTVSLTFMLFTTRLAIFCTMLSIVLLYGSDQMTAAKVFVISAYYHLIAEMMSHSFVRTISEMAEVIVVFKRVQEFMEMDEKEMNNNNKNGQNVDVEFDSIQNKTISIKNGTARWTMPRLKNILQKETSELLKSLSDEEEDVLNAQKMATLSDINVEFSKGKLIGIIGSVGCGKSSFLQILLRELPLETGSMTINGSISYASQESWIFSGSIRQNILFGKEYDRDHYDAVIKACALIKDFEQLENGDQTIVGDRGVNLSGGQKARLK